jgi:sugar diacid utilization regulator
MRERTVRKRLCADGDFNMSITVARCLELAALKDAAVVSGREGLGRTVSSVSVLEYAYAPLLGDELFVGNELIITAFITAKDDVSMQCQVLRKLHADGVVAVVVYYVGVFLPEIDERLIVLSNELKLPLIMMPPERLDYRYGDVISEVMEAIVRNRMQESFFVSETIESILELPDHRRTIPNLLRILSNRLHCTLIATNDKMEWIGEALWPMSAGIDCKKLISVYQAHLLDTKRPANADVRLEIDDADVSRLTVKIVETAGLYVLIVQLSDAINKAIDEYTLQQIAETLHLFVNVSKYPYKSQHADNLVHAILKADTHLMTREARQINIDLKAIQTMWVLIHESGRNGDATRFGKVNRSVRIKTFLSERYKNAVFGSYGDSTVVLMGLPLISDYEETAAEDFMDTIYSEDPNAVLCCFPRLSNAIEVRDSYAKAHDYWYVLKTIFPLQRIFNMNELRFAQTCQEILNKGDLAVKQSMSPIENLLSAEHFDDLFNTLSIFLLDAKSSVPKTANIAFLHQSTVKYRLKNIKQKLHCDITKLPDAYELYLAAAMKRLSSKTGIL